MPFPTRLIASVAHSKWNVTSASSASRPVPVSRHLVFGTLASGGLAIDLATKSWMFGRLGMPGEGGRIDLWQGVLTLETHLNEGALFGMGQGRVPWFVAAALVAAIFILYWLFYQGAARDWWLTVALGSVSGGMLGNLYDRLGWPALAWNYPPARLGERVHAVRDWIHFQIPGVLDWPVFNVADSLLVCGALMLMAHALFVDRRETPPDALPTTPAT